MASKVNLSSKCEKLIGRIAIVLEKNAGSIHPINTPVNMNVNPILSVLEYAAIKKKIALINKITTKMRATFRSIADFFS